MSENPYAAPAAKVADVADDDQSELAPRFSRLVAVIINMVLSIPLYVLIFYLLLGSAPLHRAWMILIAIYMLILVAINVALLHRNGQTIGNKALRVKIVRNDGARAGLARILGLRMIANGIATVAPAVGSIYAIIDVLAIFRENRRCIHDRIAGTKVVCA